MKIDRVFTHSARLIRARKYGEAIRLLEPEVVRYRDSFHFFYLLAIAYLHTGDSGGAFTYFRRAREIRMRDPNILLGLSLLYLRRGETDRAVELYLDILEQDPSNRRAKRGLSLIRKRGDPEAIADWLSTSKARRIYPRLPKVSLSAFSFFAVAISAVIAVIGIPLILIAFKVLPNPFVSEYARPGIRSVDLDAVDRASLIDASGVFRYVLTERKVLEEFETAQRLFLEYRDEAARVSINRILESNASVAVKQKARLLGEFAVVPGFDTLKDRFTYSRVAIDPPLYRDCHVIWRGMAANIKLGEASTEFDLLVGYDTRSALEGIVPVRFDFAITIDVDRPLEVLGRITPMPAGIALSGVALHQAASIRDTVDKDD